jgi:NAD(P)-dependent dehydrogenase (short-subunit alcohol dehydrogenase family)
MRLQGKVALVTGAAQGIGAVYAKALAKEGAKVALADMLDAGPVVEEIRKAGGEAMALTVDVSDEASVDAMVDAVVARHGRLDILVSNAALFAKLPLRPFETIPVAEWDKVYAVNVRGTFLCNKAAVAVMRKQKYGRIVNIASGTLYKGIPYLLHYVSSKGAVLAMSRAISREVGADGICVNTLSPGLVLSEGVQAHTEMMERLSKPVRESRAIKRDQMPEDLIGALVFLCSDDCAFMTGQSMVVDGGSVNN